MSESPLVPPHTDDPQPSVATVTPPVDAVQAHGSVGVREAAERIHAPDDPQPSAATATPPVDAVQVHGIVEAPAGSESPPVPPSPDDRRRSAATATPLVDEVPAHGIVEAPDGSDSPPVTPGADDRRRSAATATPLVDEVPAHGIVEAPDGSDSPPVTPGADNRRSAAPVTPSVDAVQVHSIVEAPQGLEFPPVPPSPDDRRRSAATLTPPVDAVPAHGIVEAPDGSEFPPVPPSADDRRRSAPPVTPPVDAAPAHGIVEAPEEAERVHAASPLASQVDVPRRAQVAAARHRTPAEKTESARSDGRTKQSSLLVMVPIRAGQYDALLALLDKIANPDDGNDFEVNRIIPFARIRTLHFARILLHQPSPAPDSPLPTNPPPPAKDRVQVKGPPITSNMRFTTDFDGPLDEHIDDVLNVAGPGLDQVFGHCEGWPGSEDRAGVHGYFLRNRIASSTFNTDTRNRSVDQIHREEDLHQRISAYLDREAGEPGFSTEPLEVREKIRDFVFAEPELAWARQQPGGVAKPRFNPASLKQAAIGFVVALLAAFTVAKNLIQDGATGEQRFKAYSPDSQISTQVWYSQIPTQVWYSAYRSLSVDNINNNTKIRLGLYGDMSAADAGVWVRRFGGSTSVENTVAALGPRAKNPAASRVEMEYPLPVLPVELLGAGMDSV